MISNLGKYIPFIFLITCVFVFIDSLISFQELHNIQNDQRSIAETYQIIHEINATIRDVIKAEANQRDYLLSDNIKYLTDYKNNWLSVQNNLTVLKQLVSKDSAVESRAKKIQSLATERKNLLDSGVSIFQQSTIANAQDFVTTHNGPHILDTLIQTGNQLVDSQNILLQQRRSAFNTSTFHMYTTIVLSAILNICLLIFAYIAIMRELQRRTLLEQKKNEFISLASHELKTPITTINIFAELLDTKLTKKTNKEAHRILSKMKNQIKEMNNLINDLLDVTRIQLGKLELQKENFLLREFLQETIEDIQATTIKHHITLKCPTQMHIDADKQRLWQILANLLNNAIKYSPKGGLIHVLVQRKPRYVVIHVKDYGVGISRENQQYVFDRYFREEGSSERQFAGLGLGLYLAQQIIHLHNGRIWVKSTPGKGATFSFTLPIARKRRKKQ